MKKQGRDKSTVVQTLKHLPQSMDNDFQCPICFDSVPENLTTQIPQCKHRFCVACLAEFVRVKLNSHEYPLLCPTCVAEPRPQPTAEIENLVVDQLSERDLSILEEIRKKRDGFLKIECPRCQRSDFIHQAVLKNSRHIRCPVGCGFRWCQKCQQCTNSILRRLVHFCSDGTSRLLLLAKKENWKQCPGCSVVVSQAGGCSHMTCKTLGCNTHFCYDCGKIIIKSAEGQGLRDAISHHNRNCITRRGLNQIMMNDDLPLFPLLIRFVRNLVGQQITHSISTIRLGDFIPSSKWRSPTSILIQLSILYSRFQSGDLVLRKRIPTNTLLLLSPLILWQLYKEREWKFKFLGASVLGGTLFFYKRDHSGLEPSLSKAQPQVRDYQPRLGVRSWA
ncbi:hypothetical protein H2248_010704 [Termitomyces sp. 'cryptogamus']|nr:hypothetical protein H2248_010704 [Termitomyces sp. 'cryptogamus']